MSVLLRIENPELVEMLQVDDKGKAREREPVVCGLLLGMSSPLG